MQPNNRPQLSVIQPPENLDDLIGRDERSVYEPLWSAHLVQSLAHWLMHAHPTPIGEANALRNLEMFYGGTPLVFRKAAARLYTLTPTLYKH